MTAWQARHGLTAAQYQTTFDDLMRSGFRLVDVSGYTEGATVRYTGIWQRRSGPGWQARHGVAAADYQNMFDTLRNQGLHLVRVNGYATPAGTAFACIWEDGPAPAWEAHHGLDSAAYQAEFTRLAGLGYRLIDVSGYAENGQVRYAGVWQQIGGPAWQARHGLDGNAYQAAFDTLMAQGFVLARVSVCEVGGSLLYAAIWVQRGSIGWQGRHNLDTAQYQRAFDDLLYQGYRLRQLCGSSSPNGARFAGVWENEHYGADRLRGAEQTMQHFMAQFGVPGLSIAISAHGRLVHARALGMADKAHGEAMTVRHRLRIASVSKPITSVTVMRLIELRRVGMSSHVFGPRRLLGTVYGNAAAYSANERAITLEQLLKHTAGMPTNDGNDPMFREPARDAGSLIGWVLDTRDPTGVPGSMWQYSNFGYCVIGRIIERRTGMAYAGWVQRSILDPAGVTSMQIAGNTLADRAPNESVYYGQGGDDPYSMQVARMDAHGGWISTAIDLLRFLRAVDGLNAEPDLLSAASVARMTTGSTARANYACGWSVDGAGNWDHNGALPGTLSMLRRRADGIGQAALVNTRQPGPAQNAMMAALYKMMEDVTAQLGPAAPFDLFG